MAGFDDPSERPQPPHVQKWREVLNMHWPAHPLEFENRWPGIPVTVRVVWEEFGEEWMPGTAKRWDAGHVYVEVVDHPRQRLNGNGVWLKPCDVYRAEPS